MLEGMTAIEQFWALIRGAWVLVLCTTQVGGTTPDIEPIAPVSF